MNFDLVVACAEQTTTAGSIVVGVVLVAMIALAAFGLWLGFRD